MATPNGTQSLIRLTLKQHGILTASQIAEIIGRPTRIVSNAMQEMTGIYKQQTRNNASARFQYSLTPFPVTDDDDDVVTKKPRHAVPPPYRPMNTPEMKNYGDYLYSHSRLAMLAR